MADKRCPKCGKMNSASNRFCGYCGYDLSHTIIEHANSPTETSTWNCSVCGQTNSIDNEFCMNCGTYHNVNTHPNFIGHSNVSDTSWKMKIVVIAVFAAIIILCIWIYVIQPQIHHTKSSQDVSGTTEGITSALLSATTTEEPISQSNTPIETFGSSIEMGLEYRILQDGTAEITKYTGNATSLDIPHLLDDRRVTSIGDQAFSYCDSLASITLPSSVSSIGNYSFSYCHNLTSVLIPEGVTSIGVEAFYHCDRLSSVTLPYGVVSIGYSAFNFCSSLSSITIPSSITSLEYGMFYGCDNLTSFVIPESIMEIKGNPFVGCNRLFVSISKDNPLFTIIDDVLFDIDMKTLISYLPQKMITTYTVPYGVTSIADGAFALNNNLTSVSIPNSVVSIGKAAFSNCHTLTSVTLPNSITNIGIAAFSTCNMLTSIMIPNAVTVIEERVFDSCSSLTSVTIPSTVITIGNSAFAGCSSLQSLSLPTSLISIGDDAFSYCPDLTVQVIEDSYAEKYCNENGITVYYSRRPSS